MQFRQIILTSTMVIPARAGGNLGRRRLRNPWRISFYRLTNDLYIGDVGQGQWEEIDFQSVNSTGGRIMVGIVKKGPMTMSRLAVPAPRPPIFEYPHTETPSNPPANCSVTGGYVYRGPAYPALQGHYFFADYCSGRFWSLFFTAPNNWIATAHGQLADGPVTFGEDLNGELYVATHNGAIYRRAGPPAANPPPQRLFPLCRR